MSVETVDDGSGPTRKATFTNSLGTVQFMVAPGKPTKVIVMDPQGMVVHSSTIPSSGDLSGLPASARKAAARLLEALKE
jgi:hypothetical protein